jgi:nucleoside-diphosphate-sugar epimerase
MRVLFIGGTGLIGHQVVPILKESHDVTVAALGGGVVAGLTAIDVDICDLQTVEKILDDARHADEPFDAIVNCAVAAHRGVNKSTLDDLYRYNDQCINVNARGAYNVYEAAWRVGVPRVVFISSLTASLGSPRHEFIDKHSQDRPANVYAVCKIFGEYVGRYFAYRAEAGREPLKVVGLRLGHPHIEADDYWKQSRKRRSMMVHGRDVAHAISCALEIDVQFGVYSIVSESDVPYIDRSLYSELQYRPKWKFTAAGLVSTSLNGVHV